MQLRQIMTSGVVTAGLDADLLKVAQMMRDHNVGSVVLCDPEGEPMAMVTDRDLAVRGLAADRQGSEPVRDLASRPLVTGEPDMDLEEADQYRFFVEDVGWSKRRFRSWATTALECALLG